MGFGITAYEGVESIDWDVDLPNNQVGQCLDDHDDSKTNDGVGVGVGVEFEI